MTLADQIVVLKDRVTMQVASPRELYENPQNAFVAQFIGSPKMNLMALADGTGAQLSKAAQDVAHLKILPEHIGIVAPDAGHCAGQVQVGEYLGADYFHYIDCGDLGVITLRTAGA